MTNTNAGIHLLLTPVILLVLAISLLVLCSLAPNDDSLSEYIKLQKLEQQALKKGIVREYIYDLTHKKDCNKTKINYLGVVHMDNGRQYKILTSFFVFSTGSDMCHGTSNIKIYDMKNRFVGEYYVGTPENLPDTLQDNKLCYLENSEECNLRKTGSIDLRKGLPKTFYIPCSKNGGDVYSFSSGD
ncbi:hypothetical protein QNI19_01295 [Cytophagaceae bacterium DM2B3-1]|uniref:Uncharacterized protein n=1 Tax=Xanthocytophaga flava TaxID=3048013 RepID=A0ABT7CD34_9BACT|nr:hypothetical protein [Xanthocytophaga flavus]MDJ1491543.1 hypothetical protein [Xanthocytophaga flavus]